MHVAVQTPGWMTIGCHCGCQPTRRMLRLTAQGYGLTWSPSRRWGRRGGELDTNYCAVMADAPWLNERRTWTGRWWLPDKPDEAQPGVLTYDPSTGLELSLIGGFEDRVIRRDGPNIYTELEGSRAWDTLHGLAENKEITLFDCLAIHSKSFGFGFGGPHDQLVRASRAVVGTHLGTTDEAVFTKVQTLIEDTWQWAAEGALTASMALDDSGNRLSGHSTIKTAPIEKKSVQVEGLTIELDHHITMPNYTHERRGSFGYVRDTVVLSAKGEELLSLREVDGSVQMLQDLVTLAAHRGAAVLWCRALLPPLVRELVPADYPEVPRIVELYQRRALIGAPSERGVDTGDMLFTLSDLPFEQVIPRWIEIRETFGAACSMIQGARYSDPGYLETQLITAATGAEAFHEETKYDPPIPPEEYAALKLALAAAVPPERRDWIKNIVSNRPSLRMRLEALADRLPSTCVADLLPDKGHWAKRTARARNDLSHAGKSPQKIDELHAIVEVTKAVVVLNLLQELGVDETRLREVLQTNNGLRRACRLAQVHLSLKEG